MEKNNGSFALKIAVPLALFFALGILFFVRSVSSLLHATESVQEDRNYHILVVGQAGDSVFLNQLFEGARSLSRNYSALVELKSPDSLAEDISLQSLIDYASFVNADGIIAYVSPETAPFKSVSRIDGTEIPVITIGYYDDKNPQISFIGSNYSNLGRRMGIESEELFTSEGKVFVVISGISGSANHSNLLNSLLDYYKSRGIENFEVFGKSLRENKKSVEEILLCGNNEGSALVCLTEEDTVMALQIAAACSDSGRIEILGYGENEALAMYLEKGVLSKLVSFNPSNIGKTAMAELFEYRNKGYANSYITADLQVRRSE
ncbi:substrate-binding domain-containing protein [Treponema sp.]|uniref:substrate-binding domain-containing protein n=1 Tax=Treponema sp. TaxID=166 RepID=UPI003F0EA925